MSSIWSRRAPDLAPRLEGGIAVITGAGSGIGRALAREAAARGMRLSLLDVSQEGLDETRAGLPEASVIQTAVVDVRRPDGLQAAAAALPEAPVLVFANAGVLSRGLLADQSADDVRRMMEVNVMGVLHTIQAFAPRMLASDLPSRIVVTGSQASFASFANLGGYSATKHAVLAMVRALAQEWTDTSLSVALLAPGGVETPINGSIAPNTPLMSPSEAAAIAFAGAVDGRLLISTHDDLAAMVAARNRGIESALIS